ncbi:hypothetical protein [Myxococcus virescens]|uniref:Uncharacterized protein n=2 Tax=Myxococcus virescens TaxID=83456 RepID=A0ABY0N0P5_9BACT|nr:hypothetical protein [Myxococcus virescens]SDE80650.1 hypothetical protein SAMN04488504_11288 [Myxococcus virescens]
MTMTAILLVSLTMGLGAAAPAGARAEVTWPAVAPSTVQLRAPGSAAPPSDVSSLLASRCRQWAATPDNPWALAHGLALDGRDFRTRDGQPAADTIIARYLRRTPPPSHAPAAAQRLFFDSRTANGTPVEPHPALQLKSLLHAGYPVRHRFNASWGPVMVQALVEQLQLDFRPSLVAHPEGAWALDALSLAMEPGATFRTSEGTTVHIDAVMRDALATLEAAQAELSAAMRAGRTQVPKRKQGIYAHPCGGLHYFQAVAGWARHASVRKAWRKRLDAQVDVLLYRLDSEGRQYEAALADAPFAHRLPLLVQMLKFQGHLLETLGRYRDDTRWRPTKAQQQTVERARTALEHTVRRLEAGGAFDGWSALAERQPQLALDLLGDTCHAARGEALWRTPAVSAPAAQAPAR